MMKRKGCREGRWQGCGCEKTVDFRVAVASLWGEWSAQPFYSKIDRFFDVF